MNQNPENYQNISETIQTGVQTSGIKNITGTDNDIPQALTDFKKQIKRLKKTYESFEKKIQLKTDRQGDLIHLGWIVIILTSVGVVTTLITSILNTFSGTKDNKPQNIYYIELHVDETKKEKVMDLLNR